MSTTFIYASVYMCHNELVEIGGQGEGTGYLHPPCHVGIRYLTQVFKLDGKPSLLSCLASPMFTITIAPL